MSYRIQRQFSVVALFFFMLLQSCTVTRVAVFFMPSVSDYKVFACDTIKASSNCKAAFALAEKNELPDIKTWVPAELRGKAKNIEEFLEITKSTSLLVVKNDTILFEAYANKHQKEDPQIVFSVTKAVTSMLVAIAVKEGKLKLEQKVSDFIPEFAGDERRDITVRHLLNMVSGLKFDDKKDLARLSVLYYSNNQGRFVRNFNKVQHQPGTHFAYKSVSTQVLGQCLEIATGKKQKDYLKEKLWDPLGMEFDALYTKDSKKSGNNRSFAGIAMRSRDMLRLGKLLLNKGKWDGVQMLPESYVEALMERDMKDDTYWGYVNCFWRDGYIQNSFLEDNDFFAAGYRGQYIYVNPKENVIIVRQGKREAFRWPLIFGRLAATLSDKETDLSNPCRNYDIQFEGVYESSNGEKFELIYKGINPENQLKEWIIKKDINQTLKTKKILVAHRFDGRTIGIRKFSYVCRAIFDIQEGKVVGMHYDDQRAVDMRYFTKKGEIPLKHRKEILAKMK